MVSIHKYMSALCWSQHRRVFNVCRRANHHIDQTTHIHWTYTNLLINCLFLETLRFLKIINNQYWIRLNKRFPKNSHLIYNIISVVSHLGLLMCFPSISWQKYFKNLLPQNLPPKYTTKHMYQVLNQY